MDEKMIEITFGIIGFAGSLNDKYDIPTTSRRVC